MSWIGRFGLHLAAALGATGIFVAAAAVGASQTRPPDPDPVAVVSPTPAARPGLGQLLTRRNAVPQTRSMVGTVREVRADEIVIANLRGLELRIRPAPGALIRLNGRNSKLDALQAGDRVTVLGQAQARDLFMAHAVLARRR
jgi:hypothetical protein